MFCLLSFSLYLPNLTIIFVLFYIISSSQPARVALPVQDERGHRLAGRRRPPLPRRGGRGALRRRGAVLRAHGRLGGEGLQHRGHVQYIQ